jgi:negative regulator of genetic competence, sporulation and motility
MEVQELIDFAKQSQGLLSWDTSSLIRVGGQLAVKVNGIKNLSGQEKQKLICQVLKRVLEDVEKQEKSEAGKTEDDLKAITAQFASLKKAVDDVIPASLDLALAAARGKLDLKKVKMSVWVKYFSCCARSVVTALVSNNVISQAQAKQATDALTAVEEKASDAAEKYDAAHEEKKETFEQENPMLAQKSESSTEESKPEETVKSE